MEIILIYIVIAVGLFISAYITKRRFGLLGLALASGSLLSQIWGYDIGLIASGFGLPSNPLTVAIITSLVVLLPAGVLLFHGYTYKNKIARIVGAAMFTLLALAFLVEPLGNVLMPTGSSFDIYIMILKYRTLIIGAGLILAVLDLFLTKPAHLSDKKSKH
ncbi:MAG: hypothetical protein WCQ49_03235 [Candidatus Saccharibacteria bacterium]